MCRTGILCMRMHFYLLCMYSVYMDDAQKGGSVWKRRPELLRPRPATCRSGLGQLSLSCRRAAWLLA